MHTETDTSLQNASGVPPYTIVYYLDLSYTCIQAREMCLFLRNVLYTIVYQISLPYTSYTRYTLYMTTICLCILEYPRFLLLEALYTMVYLIDPLYTLYTLYTSQKSAVTHQNASSIPLYTIVY